MTPQEQASALLALWQLMRDLANESKGSRNSKPNMPTSSTE
jgi:hypothetical protein